VAGLVKYVNNIMNVVNLFGDVEPTGSQRWASGVAMDEVDRTGLRCWSR